MGSLVSDAAAAHQDVLNARTELENFFAQFAAEMATLLAETSADIATTQAEISAAVTTATSITLPNALAAAKIRFQQFLDSRRSTIESAQDGFASAVAQAEAEINAELAETAQRRLTGLAAWLGQAIQVGQILTNADAVRAQNYVDALNAAGADHAQYQHKWQTLPARQLAGGDLLKTIVEAGELTKDIYENWNWSEYGHGVVDVVKGYKNAAVNTAKSLVQLVLHPIDTAKGLAHSAMHPMQTLKLILQDIKEKSQTLEGQGELVGDILITLASGGAAKAVKEAGYVARVANAANKRLPKRLKGAGRVAAQTVDEVVPDAETLTHQGDIYEVIFRQGVSGTSRTGHRKAANKAFLEVLENDPNLAKQVSEFLDTDDVIAHMNSGKSGLKNPPGTEWHHPINDPDVVQLLRREVHRHPELQDVLHPDGFGGYAQYYGN